MVAFTLAQSISRAHVKDCFNRFHQNTAVDGRRRGSTTATCQATPPSKKLSRRAILSLLAASAMYPIHKAQADELKPERYDANKTRRYVETGRPAPDRPKAKFTSDKAVFDIDERLSAQDLKRGTGELVGKGTLVMARWVAVLENGTTVDDANERQAALFRPGTHQVAPGIEDGVVGMREGGVRRVSGSSERILSNVAVGYDIGERSLVPNGSTMYVDIFVDRVNPYGTAR